MNALGARLDAARLAVRRAILLRRRLLAAVLAAAAVLTGLRATAAPDPPSDSVVVATHDLVSGVVLRSEDVRTARFAEGTAPAGSLTVVELVGRTLAAPLRAGEPITDLRLVTPGLLEGYDGLVAVPVRIPDQDTVALLAVGDRINLLSTDPRGGGTTSVLLDAPVLALPRTTDTDSGLVSSGAGGASSGRLVVLGASPTLAKQVADAAIRGYLSITFGG